MRAFLPISSVFAGILLLILTIVLCRPSFESFWYSRRSSDVTYFPEAAQISAEEGHPDLYAEYHRRIRASVNGINEYPIGYRMTEFNKALRAAKTLESLNWVERGPGNVGGRTRSLIVDPDDPNRETIWAGSVSGGLWKTTDGGRSWQAQTDHFPSLSVSSLAMAESNHDVIYLGTGGRAWNEPMTGLGIFRSGDQGVTWEHLRSTHENDDFLDVYRLLVDPVNSNVVIAATNGGLFRTSDSGITWRKVCCRDSYYPHMMALQAQPGNFNVQIAAGGREFPFYSLDAGLTWQQADSSSSVPPSWRIEFAYSPSDPNIAYAAAFDSGIMDLYKSYDGGINWVLTTDDQARDWTQGRGYWHNSLAVHPFQPNTVFVGGVNLHRILISDMITTPNEPTRTTDFGINVDRAAHADHHIIMPVVVDSLNERFWVFNANDGGVAISKDNGRFFEELDKNGSGYNTSQFYGVAKKPGAHVYIGGTQDNGTWLSESEPEANSQWDHRLSGDGFEALWHSTNPNLLLGSIQYSMIAKSTDGGNSWRHLPDMRYDVELGQFFTTLSNSDMAPDDVYTAKRNGVYYSRNFGDSWTHTPINELWNCGRYSTVRVSQADPAVIWAGCGFITQETSYHLSQDRGISFGEVSFPNIPGFRGGYSSGIATHPTEPATAYALFSQRGQPKILETQDYGKSWTDLSGFGRSGESSNGFPDVAVYDLVVMPHAPNTLWAGTEIGLFRSTNRGQQWYYVDDGLPPVAIWRMKVRDDEVILGTHGRGIWTVPRSEIETLAFSRRISDMTLTEGVPVTPVQLPEALGGQAPLTYELDPPLPAGVVFNSTTRALAGTPTVPMDTTTYTYTVTDANSKSINLSFRISVAGAVRFHTTIAHQAFPRAHPIDPLKLPTAVGGVPPVIYTITPELPPDLSFLESTHTISGTPTMVTGNIQYSYLATDVNGSSDSLQFSLMVYSPTGVQTETLPVSFSLRGNYPNPFVGFTRIVMDLPTKSEVSVDVLDVTGRRVRRIPTQTIEAGWERGVNLNGAGLPSGMYLYRVQVVSPEGTITQTGQFIHIH